MTNQRNPLTGLTPRGEAGFFLMSLFVVFVLLLVLEQSIDIPFLRVLDIVLGTLLTVVIALVYYRQTDLMERQTRIEDRTAGVAAAQTQILKENTTPIPIVTDFWVSNTGNEDPRSESGTQSYPTGSIPDADNREERLLVELSNESDSPAKNLRVVCLPNVVRPEGLKIEPQDQPEALDPCEKPLSEVKRFYTSVTGRDGAVLPADATNMQFSTTSGVRLSATGGIQPLPRTIRRVVGEHDHILQLGFVLLYDSIHDETGYIPMDPGFELKPGQCDGTDDIDIEMVGRCGELCEIDTIVESSDWEPPATESSELDLLIEEARTRELTGEN